MAESELAAWVSRLGLEGDEDRSSALREALAASPESTDQDTIRLLTAAAANARGGAQALVSRIAAHPGRTIAALAAAVGAQAAGTPHPWHLFQAVAKSAADAEVPLMSDTAYGGMARMQAASCRQEVADELFQQTLAAERIAQRPLMETAAWRAVVARTAPEGGWQRIFAAIEVRDVDALIDAALSAAGHADTLTALGLLRALFEERDGRLSGPARSRLLDGLRAQAANPDAHDALEAWAHLDPVAYFDELALRADGKGVLDQRLLRFLGSVAKDLSAEQRQAAGAAFERIVRRQIALGVAPFESLDLWRTFDRTSAASFIGTRLDPQMLDGRTAQAVIPSLQALGTKEAVGMLRRLHAAGGVAAEYALLSLEVLEVAPQDRIERVVARFRAGEGRALRELHDRWIDRCGGRPFGVWRERLGETAGERCFWIRSGDGTASLFVETDRKDRLTGWSLR